MTNENQMLQEASSEIKRLRKQNEIMRTRLDMFDSVMELLHIRIENGGQAMTPDLVYKIDKHIASQSTESKG